MATLQKAQPQASTRGGIVLRLVEKRWLIVACLVLGWAVGIAAGRLLPRKYHSETVILIEQPKVPEHLVEPNITVDVQQQRLQSISEQILSRTRLLSLIEKFHLYGNLTGNHDPDSMAELMKKDIKVELIDAQGKRGQLAAFRIGYSASSPMLAREVTSELASQFINETLLDRKELSEDTTSFLQNELDGARQSLTEQEEKLREFRSQSLGELPEQLQSNLQILAGLQIQLRDANDSLSQAEQHELYLRSLYRQYQISGVSGAPGSSTVRSPENDLTTLKAQLSELQSRYTDEYPEVIRMKQQIADLEVQKAKAASRRVEPAKSTQENSNTGSGTGQENSLLIQLDGELSANELSIKNTKSKILDLEKQTGVYQNRLNAMPDREEKAAAVKRDYDQSRSYYETLLGKKLQSEMATELEKRRQGGQFRMIDPPNLPRRPYWPNPLLCSLAGLAGGLAVGVAITLLLGLVNARVYQETELAEFIGAGYVLALPTMDTQQERTRARRLKVFEYTIATILVLLIPAVTIFDFYKS